MTAGGVNSTSGKKNAGEQDKGEKKNIKIPAPQNP
jgi:hypothetical protein